MSAAPKQHVVLCEGFDDRSFWKGWLLRLGCTDPTNNGSRTVSDRWGRPVRGRGRFLFSTPTGSDVIVQPFHGRSRARDAVREYLGQRQVYRPGRVILNLDSDAEGTDGESAQDQVRGIALDLGASSTTEPPFDIDGSLLFGLVWQCSDGDSTLGLPEKQTLERLVCAALNAGFPGRGPAVERWLQGEPIGLNLAKSYAYSYFAKWLSSHGAGDFYQALWRQEVIAEELERRLRVAGAWQVVEELVAD